MAFSSQGHLQLRRIKSIMNSATSFELEAVDPTTPSDVHLLSTNPNVLRFVTTTTLVTDGSDNMGIWQIQHHPMTTRTKVVWGCYTMEGQTTVGMSQSISNLTRALPEKVRNAAMRSLHLTHEHPVGAQQRLRRTRTRRTMTNARGH